VWRGGLRGGMVFDTRRPRGFVVGRLEDEFDKRLGPVYNGHALQFTAATKKSR